MTINERLFMLMREQNRKQYELARAIGIPERNVSTWKERGTDPPAKLAVPIANFFGVRVEGFLTGDGIKNAAQSGGSAPSEGETEILRIYNSLDARSRHSFLGMAYEFEDNFKTGGNNENN